MGVALVCKFATSGLLLGGLARDYLTSVRASVGLLLEQAARRAEGATPGAARLTGGSDAGRLLGDILERIPEIEGATIKGPMGPGGPSDEVVRPAPAGEDDWTAGVARRLISLLGMEGQLVVEVPMRAPGAPEGLLVATLSPTLVPKVVLANTLDSLTILFISILFAAELLVILRYNVGTPGARSPNGPGRITSWRDRWPSCTCLASTSRCPSCPCTWSVCTDPCSDCRRVW